VPFASFNLRSARLKMVGSCRDDADAARLAELQAYARELGLEACVDWYINVPYTELRRLLGGAVGGLHTMVDEHFGISVVEYMAAGVIPIAHNSGAPSVCMSVRVHICVGRQAGGSMCMHTCVRVHACGCWGLQFAVSHLACACVP